MTDYVVGVDVGTTGTKAMVFALDGTIVGSGYREYTLNEPRPDWVEVGAGFVLGITFDAVKEAVTKSNVPPSQIRAVSFSVNRSSFCLMDENLDVIDDKFYLWLDSRAKSVMDEMNAKFPPETRNIVTGMPDANIFAAAKYYWVKENEPETYAKTKYFSTVQSYILHGFGSERFVVEKSDGTVTGLMDVSTLDWSAELASALDFDLTKFPPLCAPGEVVGSIGEEVSEKTGLVVGTKIVAGSGDQQLSALGAGVIKDGAASLTLGTFGLLAVGLANPDFPKLIGMMIPSSPVLGVFEVEGPQVSGATCYRWARDTLCTEELDEGEATDIDPYVLMDRKYISQSPPGANGVLFYAALFGSGYPTWDTDATGMFLGLRNIHTKADLIRSVMEGVTLEARNILDSMMSAGVQMEDIITLTGGASKSPSWCQIVADVFGRSVRTLDVPDAAALGAAGLAAVGAGLYPNVEAFVSKMVRFDRGYEPIPSHVELYNKTLQTYKDAYAGLKEAGVFNQLAALRPSE